eukprot:1181500-Prorocentrum_minimum.AAC.6
MAHRDDPSKWRATEYTRSGHQSRKGREYTRNGHQSRKGIKNMSSPPLPLCDFCPTEGDRRAGGERMAEPPPSVEQVALESDDQNREHDVDLKPRWPLGERDPRGKVNLNAKGLKKSRMFDALTPPPADAAPVA